MAVPSVHGQAFRESVARATYRSDLSIVDEETDIVAKAQESRKTLHV